MKIDELLERALAGWLGRQSVRYREVHRAAVLQFSRELGDMELEDLTYSNLEVLENRMAAQLARTTVATYLRHLRVLMKWGVVVGELANLPPFPKIRTSWQDGVRNRPATEEEYRQMLAVANWRYQRLLTVMWLAGLRVSEAVMLSWDAPPFQLDFSGRFPRFRIRSDGQKARRDELAPCTPDFVEWLNLLDTTRVGRVCGLQVDSRSATHTVSRLARRAGVPVTSHDLRRSFGTRWSQRVKAPVLARLLRHRSIGTSLKYYVSQEADEIAEGLWSLP